MFVGLVRDPDRRRPPPDGDERPRPWPRPSWRPWAWVALLCWLTFAADQIGGFAGYLVFLLVLAIGCWRVDRWLGKQYWGGLTQR